MASITRACFYSTPVHSLQLHASPAWHHLLELLSLCGGLSPLAWLCSVSLCSPLPPSSQHSLLTAQHWQAGVKHRWVCVWQLPLEGSRAPAHPSLLRVASLAPRGWGWGGREERRVTSEHKALVRGMLGAQRQAGGNVDRSGWHWTPVAVWTLRYVAPQQHTDTDCLGHRLPGSQTARVMSVEVGRNN